MILVANPSGAEHENGGEGVRRGDKALSLAGAKAHTFAETEEVSNVSAVTTQKLT